MTERKEIVFNDKDKVNYQAIDIARFVMSVFVVSLHTLPFYYFDDTLLYRTWWIIAQSSVPVFLLLAGLLLWL